MTVMIGFDPAPKNFGFSVVEIDQETPRDWTLVFCGTLNNTIDSFDVFQDIDNFHIEIEAMLEKFQPDRIVIERFMNRGMMGGAFNEKINIMIGMLILIARKRRIIIMSTTPAAWKNLVNSLWVTKDKKGKRLPAKELRIHKTYLAAKVKIRKTLQSSGCKGEEYKRKALVQNDVPHCVDATIMCLVHGQTWDGQTKYEMDKTRLKRMIKNRLHSRIARFLLSTV